MSGAIPILVALAGCGQGKDQVADTSSAATASPCGGSTPAMVHVTAGTFRMGSPEGEVGRDDDEAWHEVTMTRDFEIGACEVTQRQFDEEMEYIPSGFADCGSDCPVETVYWHEAAVYANLLSRWEGLTPCYACAGEAPGSVCDLDPAWTDPYACDGYRLPTEAEWEYAARAGQDAAFADGGSLLEGDEDSCDDPLELDNGGILGDLAWFCGNSAGTTHAAGLLEPNAWGIHDVSGNVWEWTFDGTDEAPPGAAVDPWSSGGSFRVVRGGSWRNGAALTRLSSRSGDAPSSRNDGIGFRVARTMAP